MTKYLNPVHKFNIVATMRLSPGSYHQGYIFKGQKNLIKIKACK